MFLEFFIGGGVLIVFHLLYLPQSNRSRLEKVLVMSMNKFLTVIVVLLHVDDAIGALYGWVVFVFRSKLFLRKFTFSSTQMLRCQKWAFVKRNSCEL